MVMEHLSEVAPNLFVGDCIAERNLELLKRHAITHILQVALEVRPTHAAAFDYMTLPAVDTETQDLSQLLPRALGFIQQAMQQGGKVLVHCVAGMSRSASVACAYIMWSNQAPLHNTLTVLKARRPCVNPNQGFLWQLERLEKIGWQLELLPEWTEAQYLMHARARRVKLQRRRTLYELRDRFAEM